MFPCPDCSFSSPNKRRLFTHIRENHRREPALSTIIFGHCDSSFTASKSLLRHLLNVHKFCKIMRCTACPKIYGNVSSLQNHISHEHPSIPSTVRKEANWVSVPQVSKVVQALNSLFKNLKLDVQQKVVDPMSFVMKNRANNARLIDREITKQGISRVGLCLQVILSKPWMRKLFLLIFLQA